MIKALAAHHPMRAAPLRTMNLVFLAQRIREFRKKRLLTLEQLAERSQLTQSVLSKVENSRVTPSLAALSRIAEALGVTLAELVAGIDDERRMTVVRRGDRPVIQKTRGSFIYRGTASTRQAKRIGSLIVEIPPAAPSEEMLSRGDEEFILVTKGSVEIACGKESCRLSTGDSLFFDATESYQVSNPTNSVAEILCVSGCYE